jgi:membrane fusion protein (multidrug efflux system)
MKNNIKRLFLWSLVFIVIAALAWMKFYKSDSDSTPNNLILSNKPLQRELILKGLVVSYTKSSNNLFSSGTLLADEEVKLMPEIAGKIVSINFKEGAYVKKGTLLVKLNDNDLQPQLKKAETKLKLLELTEKRQSQLFEKQGISKQDYDIAASELASQKAEIAYIHALIEKTEIKAPFDGIIGLRNVSEGAYVIPTNIIAVIQKIDVLKVDFSIPQKYSNLVKISDSLTFKVPPDTNNYKVNIVAFEPKIDDKTRTLKIRAKFSNSGKKFLPGSYCEVNIQTTGNDKSVLVPSFALIPDLMSEFVYLYSNGIAEKRSVRTGIRGDEQIEIIEGLNPGDTVITTGIMQLRAGMKVKIEIPANQGI